MPLKQELTHYFPQPRQGAQTAAIAQLHEGLGANRLELGAAGTVRLGHGGRSAGPDCRAGRAQGPATIRPSAAPAAPTQPDTRAWPRSLSPPRTMERSGWSLGNKVWGGSGRVGGVGGVHVSKSVDPTVHLPACRVASAEHSSVRLCRFNLQTIGAATTNNA